MQTTMELRKKIFLICLMSLAKLVCKVIFIQIYYVQVKKKKKNESENY